VEQYSIVLTAIVSALVVLGAYHFLVVTPARRRFTTALETHAELLGGGGGRRATARIDALEGRLRAAEAECVRFEARLTSLEAVAQSVVPRIGFVRYNAFDDVGSDLSFALALLTRDGNGVVLSSIYSREETRTYGKAIENFVTAQGASSEEKAAIAKARAT
jgi:hypothetical protein